MDKNEHPILFVKSLLLCLGAGLLGNIFTGLSVTDWYSHIQKPSFTPPNWIFGPVWLLLYFLMATSFYLIWKKGTDQREVKTAFSLFIVQLGFNALWSVLFFGLKNPLLAFADILVLLTMIVLVAVKFYRIQKTAAYLLLPYFFWVSFAAVLNFSIWQLNPM